MRILTGDYLTVRCWCSDSEQASVNTFHYVCSSTVGLGADDAAAVVQAEAEFAPQYKAAINNHARFNGATLQVHRLTQDFITLASILLAGAGTGGTDALPRQVAGLTAWKTALAGRAFRGRTFWPFPSAAFDTGDGVPTAAAVTAYTNLAVEALNFVTVGDVTNRSIIALVIRNKPVRGVPWTSTPVTVGTTFNKWATQRRRGTFGRANVSPI